MKTIGFTLNILLMAMVIATSGPRIVRADPSDGEGIVSIIKSIKIKPCQGKESKDCYSDTDAAKDAAHTKDKPCPSNLIQCSISGRVICASQHACAESAQAGIDNSQTDTGGMECKGNTCGTKILGDNSRPTSANNADNGNDTTTDNSNNGNYNNASGNNSSGRNSSGNNHFGNSNSNTRRYRAYR